MLCDINYLVICRIFSVVFSVYSQTLYGAVLNIFLVAMSLIASPASARSINTIVPRSLILMLFMQSVLGQ